MRLATNKAFKGSIIFDIDGVLVHSFPAIKRRLKERLKLGNIHDKDVQRILQGGGHEDGEAIRKALWEPPVVLEAGYFIEGIRTLLWAVEAGYKAYLISARRPEWKKETAAQIRKAILAEGGLREGTAESIEVHCLGWIRPKVSAAKLIEFVDPIVLAVDDDVHEAIAWSKEIGQAVHVLADPQSETRNVPGVFSCHISQLEATVRGIVQSDASQDEPKLEVYRTPLVEGKVKCPRCKNEQLGFPWRAVLCEGCSRVALISDEDLDESVLLFSV